MGRLRTALGPRDEQPPLSAVGARSSRALANMHEALPVFLALALLHAMRTPDDPIATGGAALLVAARTAYVPAYLSGWMGVRSTIWVISWGGLGAMIYALLTR